MTVHVFLGPTLPVARARRILPAHYHPPAAMGDVYRCVRRYGGVDRTGDRPGTMVIVDGYFEQAPSVRHKEILYALSAGWRVLGCASMGALRAAELHPYGMTGLGAVFEAYRDDVLEDDDEVAVTHAPAEHSYRQLSEAMVDIRSTCRAAVDRSVVDVATAGRVVTSAKRMFYPDRNWPDVLAAADLPATESAALLGFVRRGGHGVKSRDAVDALTALAGGHVPDHAGASPEFEATNSWYRFVAAEAGDAG
jgi:hypothetical protein